MGSGVSEASVSAHTGELPTSPREVIPSPPDSTAILSATAVVGGPADTGKVDSSNTSESEDSTYKEKKRKRSLKKPNLTIGNSNTKGSGLSVRTRRSGSSRGSDELIFGGKL